MAAFSALGLGTRLNAVHTPLTQSLPAVHTTRLPQVVPQLASELRFVSQPSSVVPLSTLQSAKPASHTGPHSPLEQDVLATAASSRHARSQAPQCAVVVAVSTHCPPHWANAQFAVHTPLTQLSSAVHTAMLPQVVPQVAAALKSVSQPSSAPLPVSGLQSPKSAAQTGAQSPPEQALPVTLVVLQARSHAPQCAVAVAVSTHSAPHVVWVQVAVHTPFSHVSLPLQATVAPQARPQVALLFRFVSQPSSFAPVSAMQSAKPLLQLGSHRPFTQARLAVLLLPQARSQAPQCALVICVSTHSAPHSSRAQGGVHTPFWQMSPATQTARSPHVVPQLCALLRSVSQPSSAPLPSSTSQSAKPTLQFGAQVPSVQTRLAVFVLSQARSQAPQSSAVVPRLVSQPSSVPLPTSTLQSPKPGSHSGVQAPATQARVSTPSPLQARSQALQWSVAVSRDSQVSPHWVFGLSHVVPHAPSTQN